MIFFVSLIITVVRIKLFPLRNKIYALLYQYVIYMFLGYIIMRERYFNGVTNGK